MLLRRGRGGHCGGQLVDAGDFAGVGALFADGVFVGSGTTIRGREGVEKMQPVAAGR
ncbi:hypothetical protein [Nocardia sp. NPDC004260]